MRYIELFAGIGGFRMALDGAGHECVWANDIDRHAINIYNNYFGEHYEPKDIRLVKGQDIPEHDLIVGGFPCQSFSIAGKRKGFEDTRGTLFFEIMRIAKFHRTPRLLLENVKGLLSHDGGQTFRTILAALDELGYDTEWQVLNSKDFGVPQNRERVFIVGVLRGYRGRQVFPVRQDDRTVDEKRYGQEKQVAQCLTARDYSSWKGNFIMPKIAGCLSGGGHSGGLHSDMTAIPVLTPDRPEKRQNGRRFKEDGDEMFTLTAQDRHGIMTVANIVTPDAYLTSGKRKRVNGKAVLTSMCERRIRRLTVKECYRLQGFCPRRPDGSFDDTFYHKAKEVASNTQMYKTAGNAVTVNVVAAIARKLGDY